MAKVPGEKKTDNNKSSVPVAIRRGLGLASPRMSEFSDAPGIVALAAAALVR